MKKFYGLLVVLILGFGGWFFFSGDKPTGEPLEDQELFTFNTETDSEETVPTEGEIHERVPIENEREIHETVPIGPRPTAPLLKGEDSNYRDFGVRS